MHIFSLLAHPRSNSFCHAISATARSALQAAGHTIEHHDLYAEKFDPCLSPDEAYTIGDTFENVLARAADPLIQRHREGVGRAQGLLVVHPNWWGKPPAILAGWMDRILAPGVAYRLQSAAGLPEGLLSMKTALVINTSDTEPEREANDLGDPLELIWGKCVLPYCGVEDYERLIFRPVNGSSAEVRAKWLEQTRASCHAGFCKKVRQST
ncbi:NAD(P)H-dependent oxidoreductase [Nitratireductor rhodophyticola]|uniref:NAD(P)H-dependent oxidoreductase n=1 Tax=Nitratireductor rhodophyticola TaxID=2854036 RepID=UPI002AC93C01|nr:NAD(P)H-dependent oxidoreductase [Nitratireductor rhodophyticola]WPZ15119.1 NAD(P)H-dependent oxidoreductase [Nitratireductor rhodophyticola]